VLLQACLRLQTTDTAPPTVDLNQFAKVKAYKVRSVMTPARSFNKPFISKSTVPRSPAGIVVRPS
jgi:hypothetical protein